MRTLILHAVVIVAVLSGWRLMSLASTVDFDQAGLATLVDRVLVDPDLAP